MYLENIFTIGFIILFDKLFFSLSTRLPV